MLRTIAVALVLALSLVEAGPDPNPFPYCSKAMGALNRNERQKLRRAVVAVQGLSSQLRLYRLGHATSTANSEQLQAWLTTNQSAVSRLDSRGLALTCLGHRRHRLALGRPVFSFLLEYYKRPWAIRSMARNLQTTCRSTDIPCELVVNADNPNEVAEWTELAREMAGFVVPVFSANVHEARGYNRAAKAAQGQFLIIWQDDQVPPLDSFWLKDLLKLFNNYHRLAIVGMNSYRLCRHQESSNRFGATAWEPDSRTGVRWSYVQNVDFAPFVVRTSAFEALGGLDESFTRPGDCGIWGDWELCNRAWLSNWQVGYLYLDGRTGDGHEGGTHLGASAERCWGRQQHVSAGSVEKRFGAPRFQEELCGKLWQLNMATFSVSNPTKCPYGSAETKFGNCSRVG